MSRRNLKRRSECPLNASVEMLGDRWSLLLIRDMMLRGFRTYKDFMECYEGIATNILGRAIWYAGRSIRHTVDD